MKQMRALTMLAIVLLISGCAAKGRCHQVREYQKTDPVGEVAIPDDLQPLDQTEKMVVPAGERNQQSVPRSEKCLDYPPPYFKDEQG